MLSTKPPSTRSAPPVVADDEVRRQVGAQVRDLDRLDQAPDQRRRAVLAHELRGRLVPRAARSRRARGRSPRRPGVGRAGDHGVDGDPAARDDLREPARDAEQRGLGHAVVDHLLRDHDRGVRRHELHAPPAALGHPADVVAGQPDAGHHVDVPVALPQLVGDVEQRHRAEDPEVVDEDVDRGQRLEQRGRAVGGRDVGGGALEARVRLLGPQLRDDRVDPGTRRAR